MKEKRKEKKCDLNPFFFILNIQLFKNFKAKKEQSKIDKRVDDMNLIKSIQSVQSKTALVIYLLFLVKYKKVKKLNAALKKIYGGMLKIY